MGRQGYQHGAAMNATGRLGMVLYWAGCLGSLAFVACAVFVFFNLSAGRPILIGERLELSAIFLVPAVISWVVGRAFKYILAGS